MRLDDLYLVDVIEAAERVGRMIANADSAQFESDELLSSAVQYQLVVIGEACSKLQPSTVAQMPETPITQVRGFRNRLVHGYFATDLSIVWEVASQHAPSLASGAESALQSLFPDTFLRLQEKRLADGR